MGGNFIFINLLLDIINNIFGNGYNTKPKYKKSKYNLNHLNTKKVKLRKISTPFVAKRVAWRGVDLCCPTLTADSLPFRKRLTNTNCSTAFLLTCPLQESLVNILSIPIISQVRSGFSRGGMLGKPYEEWPGGSLNTPTLKRFRFTKMMPPDSRLLLPGGRVSVAHLKAFMTVMSSPLKTKDFGS